MQRSTVPLECIECEQQWEEPTDELPAPGTDFACEHCRRTGPISEFVRTREALKVLEQFHAR